MMGKTKRLLYMYRMQKVCPNHKCWTLRIESYLIFSGAALFVCYFQAEENQMKTIRPP